MSIKDQSVSPKEKNVTGSEDATSSNPPSVTLETTPTPEQMEGERLLKMVADLEKQVEAKAIESGAIQTVEGCLLLSAKRKFRGTEEDKLKQRAFYDTMLVRYGITPRTADRRAQLWDKMYDANVVDSKVLVAIEDAKQITPELLTMVQTKVGNKSGTELMREFGILPPKESSKEKVSKSATARLKDKTKLVEALLKEIKILLDGGEIEKEIPDKKLVDSFRDAYAKCETGFLLFKPLDDLTFPDPPAMPDVSSSGSIITYPKQ